jgi:hypothetical protein
MSCSDDPPPGCHPPLRCRGRFLARRGPRCARSRRARRCRQPTPAVAPEVARAAVAEGPHRRRRRGPPAARVPRAAGRRPRSRPVARRRARRGRAGVRPRQVNHPRHTRSPPVRRPVVQAPGPRRPGPRRGPDPPRRRPVGTRRRRHRPTMRRPGRYPRAALRRRSTAHLRLVHRAGRGNPPRPRPGLPSPRRRRTCRTRYPPRRLTPRPG